MQNGKFISRSEGNNLISERNDVEKTIRPIVEREVESPPNQDKIKKAKRLVRNPTEGFVFDLALLKQLMDNQGNVNGKYLVVMPGMVDPKPTVLLGIAGTTDDTKGVLNELIVLGEEPALLQHPRRIRVSRVALSRNTEGNDLLRLTLETDENQD